MTKQKLKKYFVLFWLTILFSGIAILFWYNEWVYSLPTPVPVNYHLVKTGDTIEINKSILVSDGKPQFLHFFNPDCPCSRFNISYFKSLVKAYGDKVDFTIVVMSKQKSYTTKQIQEKFGLSVPVTFDRSAAIACGVYSTPQAVIIDKAGILYYRGNYNKSRYCTDKKSNYAQLALDSLLDHHSKPAFDSYALTAYGCTLPVCNK